MWVDTKSVRFLVVLLAGLCAACAGGNAPIGLSPEVTPVEASALASPAEIDRIGAFQPYYIGPYDRLTIDVFGFDSLQDKEVQVDAGGAISLALAGRVMAGGLTIEELEQRLVERLKAAYVRDPKVAVNLKKSESQFVSVDGQVKEPGVYPVLGNMTLLRAVAAAKGTAEYAKLNDVVVLRTVDNQRYAALYNLEAIQRGNYVDPPIYADDVIIVGDSQSRRLFEQLLQAVPALSTPLIIALQR